MKPSFLCSFLFILAIALFTNSQATTTSRNETNVAITNPTIIKAPAFIIVTDDVIRQICYQTSPSSQSFCRYTMDYFKGKPLFPKPLTTVMESTQKQAKRTTKKLFNLNDGLRDEASPLKMRYNKCMKKYRKALDSLNQATSFIHEAKPSSVRMYTSMALEQVRSCDEKLGGYNYGLHEIAEDNRRFSDLANIVINICAALKPGKW